MTGVQTCALPICFDVKVKDAWIPVRIEMDEDWYLVGLPKTSLSGLTVRM